MKEQKLRTILLKHKGWLCLVLLMTVWGALFELLKAYMLQWVYDAIVNKDFQMLQRLLVAALFYIGCSMAEMQIQYMVYHKYSQMCMLSMKEHWFAAISKKKVGEYQTERASEYIAHFTSDAENIRTSYFDNFTLMLDMILTGIVAVISILAIHYIFLVVTFATFWIPIAVNKVWEKRICSSKQKVSDENGRFVTVVAEQLRGFEISKFFGLTCRMAELFRKQNAGVEGAYYRNNMDTSSAAAQSGMASVGIWFFNTFAGAFFILRGALTIGQLTSAEQLLNSVLNPLYKIPAYMVQLKAADELYGNILSRLEDHPKKRSAEESARQEAAVFDHGIHFQNVGMERMGREILKNVEFSFDKDRKYLIRGESGSGKSSMMKILLGVYPEYSGKVWIDETELRNLKQESWFEKIALVCQDDFVFADTVFHNITMYQGYSDEEIRRVIKMCALSDFLALHPEGLEFQIEENGKNISGGEKQRICLARALIRRAPILILDEATSALDMKTAEFVEENILKLPDTTVLFVSHRNADSLISQYYRVLEVRNQEIVVIQ